MKEADFPSLKIGRTLCIYGEKDILDKLAQVNDIPKDRVNAFKSKIFHSDFQGKITSISWDLEIATAAFQELLIKVPISIDTEFISDIMD